MANGVGGRAGVRLSLRKPHPSDLSDERWSLVPRLTLVTEEAPRRDHAMRERFALRYVIR